MREDVEGKRETASLCGIKRCVYTIRRVAGRTGEEMKECTSKAECNPKGGLAF